MTVRRMRMLGVAMVALGLGLAALPGWATAADAGRGKTVYETRCRACHEVSVHRREARKARSFEALRAQVRRWSAEAGGAWSAEEIDDVTLYLNDRYYRLPCPQSWCKADQASLSR